MNEQATKQCIGPCGRTLDATPEHWHRNNAKKDGLEIRCKECVSMMRSKGIRNKADMSDVPEGHKRCTGTCKQILPATAEYFYRDKKRKDGLFLRCKECAGTQQKAYLSRPEVKEQRRAHREVYLSRPEVQQHYKDYRQRTEVQEQRRAYLEDYYSRPEIQEREEEYRKKYYSRTEIQEHRQAYSKTYRSRPEIQERERDHKKEYHQRPEVKERRSAYYRRPEARSKAKTHRNRPEVRERALKRQREYYKSYYTRQEVKDEYSARSRMRRSRKKAVKGTHTHAQIQEQLKRQKHKCYYCQARLKKVKRRYVYHIEHTFPISRVVGTDIPANDMGYLVLSCPMCNQSKGDKFPWEWAQGGRLL